MGAMKNLYLEVMERADESMSRHDGSYREAVILTARGMGLPEEICQDIADLATDLEEDNVLDMDIVQTLYENRHLVEREDGHA